MHNKELFEKYFKYELLSMVGDRVPNVRMCLSRALGAHFHISIQNQGAFVFDEDVNEAVRILKKDKSTDVREPVANIQTFPLNSPSGSDVEAAEFSAKMRSMIDSRSGSSDTRESLSTWAEAPSTAINATIVDRASDYLDDAPEEAEAPQEDENLLADDADLQAKNSDEEVEEVQEAPQEEQPEENEVHEVEQQPDAEQE